MAEIYETKEERERVILVGVDVDDGRQDDFILSAEQSLDELQELARTANVETVGQIIQKREKVHPGTYIGKGKIEELKNRIWETEADSVICDDELSPAQIMNLTDALQVKVIDRTVLILDIFAAHAVTSEGKLQIELAQLHYRASRLTGLGKSLSRLGGGIGTRGPGEKKLEMDRRFIQERIAVLNSQLKEIVQNRDTMRKQRIRSHTPTVAIVGYTNAGKSTLLNAISYADVFEENQLFATLDPVTRTLEMEDGHKILFTDTVGFISKLPHSLIRAFRSTLEEARYADLILHVVDASNPQYEKQMAVVYQTLRELGIEGKQVLTVFNKIDRLSGADWNGGKDSRSDDVVRISAKEGTGIMDMLDKINKLLNAGFMAIETVIPYAEAGKIQEIRQFGKLEIEEYREDGIFVKANVPSFLV